MGTLTGAALAGLAVIVILYFVPCIIALLRGHKDAPAIIAVNVFLGWSVIGWFWAFLWALSDPRGRGATQTVVVNTAQHNFTAPQQAYIPPSGPSPLPLAPVSPPSLPSPSVKVLPKRAVSADEDDTAFWDSMVDKNDPDQLEEYVYRFPSGRFAQLAKTRLGRRGIEVPASPTADPNACGQCGSVLEPDSRFCAECGSTVTA